MRTYVRVKVPLTKPTHFHDYIEDVFEVPPPCFYCGAQVGQSQDSYYSVSNEYEVYYSVPTRKGGSDTKKFKNYDGKNLKGKWTIKLPYCPNHINVSRKIKNFDKYIYLPFIFGFIVIIVFSLIYGYWGIIPWYGSLIVSFVLFFIGFLVSFGVIALILRFITPVKIPLLQDYPLTSAAHYGVTVPKLRRFYLPSYQSPIPSEQSLILEFTRPDLANRFIDANPQAEIIKSRTLYSHIKEEKEKNSENTE